MSLEFPKVDLSGVNEAMGNLNASLEKFAEDIQKRKDNAMAMEFTRVICDLLKENGVTVEMTEIEEENHATNKFEVKYGVRFTGIDFSEHDKKVAEEKDSKIELIENINKAWIDTAESLSVKNMELSKKVEILEAIIADGKKPDISVSENGVSVGCECGGYYLAKERIEVLEKENNSLKERFSLLRTRCKPGIEKDFDKGLFGKLAIVGCNEEFTDIQNKRISELEDRHQSDCIRINQLLTTIDVLTERYQKLREVHGV